MRSCQKKRLMDSIDDVLGDLLGDDSDEFPSKPRSPVGGPVRPSGVLRTKSGKRNLLDDDFFSRLAEEIENNVEESDVSEADAKALLESMKDIDDMDADLFSSKRKSSSALAQRELSSAETFKHQAGEKIQPTSEREEKKPSSAPNRSYKKFSFLDDLDDSLGDLMDDLEQPKSVPSALMEKQPSPTALRKERQASPAPALKKREELSFDDDEDDLMDALGFSDSAKGRGNGLTPQKESEAPQRARTRLDEILGIGTPLRLQERPSAREKKDPVQPERASEKPPLSNSTGKDSPFGDEEFAFSSYQPTMGFALEGRTSRRQSARFSREDISFPSPEHKTKTTTTSIMTSTRPSRPPSDWLGLKQDEEEVEEKKEMEGTGATHSLQPSLSPSRGGGNPPKVIPKSTEDLRALSSPSETSRLTAELKNKEEEKRGADEDWLVGALSKKKAQNEEQRKKQEESLGVREQEDLNMVLSKRNAVPSTHRTEENMHDPPVQSRGQNLSIAPNPITGAQHTPESQQKPADVNTAPIQQVSLNADSLQQLLLQQQLAQTRLLGLGAPLDLGLLQKHRTDAEQHAIDLTALQARLIQLEGQARGLQLEKEQLQMLLDSVQQRHKQDTELMESTHRSRVKLLEECAAQREARARMESQELTEKLEATIKLAQLERTELQEQQQRRLAQCQQERDRDVERLRELQRKSILEMKKDHEMQVQRLRRLKDEEIDAVTSATSQTRSLTVVIEQMEQFSLRLGDLSSRIENTHESTTQGLELGARQRDEQLRVLQERLTQQQREMAEERSRLKEVIGKMDTQLAEQQRQLQQERWRVMAEQAKAESSLRGLEEERRTMTQHFTIEREELEKAKTALLEEQQSVMQRCAEERRKLAAEWTHFHSQDKLRKERDLNRESHIINIAQEQADLKLKAGELKLRDEALQKERENLDKLRDDMDRERERLNAAALRLKNRTQEVESLSQLACERYEEGERALQEAKQVEAGHKARLNAIHTETEQLRKQEQSLQQERNRMTDYHRKLNPLPTDPLTGFSPAFSSTGCPFPASPHLPPAHFRSSSVSPQLQATLAMLRHTADKDRDFLQDEQVYLETLKRAPPSSTSHTT